MNFYSSIDKIYATALSWLDTTYLYQYNYGQILPNVLVQWPFVQQKSMILDDPKDENNTKEEDDPKGKEDPKFEDDPIIEDDSKIESDP